MKILYNTLLILLFAFLATSCGDDNNEPIIEEEVIIIKVNMSGAGTTVNSTFDLADTVTFKAAILGTDLPKESITVGFKVNAAMVTAFNDSLQTSYILLPAANYSFEATATIAIGETSTAVVNVFVKDGGNLDASVEYLLPISIDQVTGGEAASTLQTAYFIFKREPAEIVLEEGENYDRSNWTIADFSTEEPAEGDPNGRAISAIDGDWATFWHSKWQGGEPAPPHHVTIDMGAALDIHGVSIVDRDLKDWAHGQPASFTIELSTDGVTFSDAISFEEVPMKTDPLQEEIRLLLPEMINARYMRLTVLTTWGNTASTNIAEIYTF